MKKILRTSLFFLFAAAFAAVSGRLFLSMDGEDTFIRTDAVSFVKPSADADAPSEAIPVMTPTGGYYIIREYGGIIGIFSVNSPDTPETTLDVYVFTLPAETADMLKVGIRCDETELVRYIEAFTS